MSGCIRNLSIWHSPVFLLNSCLDLFSAPNSRWDPLSRSYRVNLPSSLTVNHSSASVFSTQLRVSVYGTGTCTIIMLSGFSRRLLPSLSLIPEDSRTFRLRLSRRTSLPQSTPLPFNALIRKGAEVSPPRHRVARRR